jgi:hypothetical protein
MTPDSAGCKSHIRIVRRASKIRFQPDWEPVADPYAESLAARRATGLTPLPERFKQAVAGTALTLALTAVVSFGLAVETAGLTADTGAVWLAGWQSAAIIALPARFVLAPLVAALVARLFEPRSRLH